MVLLSAAFGSSIACAGTVPASRISISGISSSGNTSRSTGPPRSRSAASWAASRRAPVSSSGNRSRLTKPLKTLVHRPQRTCPCFALSCCGVTRKRDWQWAQVVISTGYGFRSPTSSTQPESRSATSSAAHGA
jgi:hypothetical protein